MPFDNAYFDGVWSLGVIEHFIDGYASIILEAKRVLRPGGYLFITVPSISPLKKIKIKLGHYNEIKESELDDFFQFAFHPKDTIQGVCKHGFELVKSYGRSGSLGFYEDAGTLAQWLSLQPYSKALLNRIIWRGADHVLKPFSYHMMYFLFRKQS